MRASSLAWLSPRASTVVVLAVLSTVVDARAAEPPDPMAPVRDGYRLTRESFLARPGPQRRSIRVPWQPPHRERLFSRRMSTLWDADARYSAATRELGNLDFDPFIFAQDAEDHVFDDLVIEIVARGAERAEVRARFTHSKPMEVRFDVVLENGRWVIDDIRAEGMSIASILAKPHLCAEGWSGPCQPVSPCVDTPRTR